MRWAQWGVPTQTLALNIHPVAIPRMQLTLTGRISPAFDPSLRGARRIDLGREAWLDHAPEFLSGHELVFDELRAAARWRVGTRTMYDRVVEVPRMTAALPPAGVFRPLLDDLAAALSARYGHAMTSVSLALYRDGDDSVAWHGDRHGRSMPQAMVATLSLGGPRRFLMRPKGGGPSRSFRLGWGDLMVMGGAAQRTWEHCVPKPRGPANPRISVMFRNFVDDPE